jgi:hypothetical protein
MAESLAGWHGTQERRPPLLGARRGREVAAPHGVEGCGRLAGPTDGEPVFPRS